MTRNPVVRGLVGTLVIVLAVLGALFFDRLPIVGSGDTLRVEFSEAAGLEGGNDVVVSGAKVGKVREVRLEDGLVVAELRLDQPNLRLGERTRARIVTITLLGRTAVELLPEGPGSIGPGDTIEVARTSSPYNLTSTLGQLASTSEQIDKGALTKALAQVSDTFADTPDDVGTAVDGISRLAAAVAENDEGLRELLASAADVTDVLASRNEQLTTLLTSGTGLLGELTDRQAVIERVLRSGQQLAAQVRAALDENSAVLKPALDELDRLLALLERNRTNLQGAVKGLSQYVYSFGEAVSTGPFFDAYIQNLTAPGSLAPLISGSLQ